MHFPSHAQHPQFAHKSFTVCTHAISSLPAEDASYEEEKKNPVKTNIAGIPLPCWTEVTTVTTHDTVTSLLLVLGRFSYS